MSLRRRLLLMVGLVALVATVLTAWLTVYQATREVRHTAAEQERIRLEVRAELVTHAQVSGTWQGVDGLLRRLRASTGQRLRLSTPSGSPVADSDAQAYRGGISLPDRGSYADGPPPPGYGDNPAAPTLVDPVPQPAPDTVLADFRRELKAAQCAWRNEISVTKRPGAEPPRFELGAGGDGCRAPAEPEELAGDERATAACLGAAPTERTLEFCRRTVFHDRVSALLPPALLLTVGEANPVLATIPVGPALLAALTVTGVAVFGVWLVGRPVLRPVTALVAASRRLAAGERADPVPVRGRDEIAGLTASFNHMAQALRRSEEQQRRMIADIAHELRTPLVNIRGYLEALKDGVVRGDPALYEELYEEALHQQQLIDDIQLLALADSGGLRQRADPVDLGDLVTAATTRHHAVATEAGITLESTVDSPSPVVLGDEKRLRQVLGNLIGNAVRATPPDGRITVSARCEGEQAVLVVADTGTGIREEDLPLVFERFWRADESRDRATGGSGLGLAIAREIVTAHGGTISVASPGGAVFTVRLPAVTGQAAGRPGLTASP